MNTFGCFNHDAFLKFTVVNELVLIVIAPDLSLLVCLIPNTVVVRINKYCKLSAGKRLVCFIVELCDLYRLSVRSVGRMCLEVDSIVYLKGDIGSC